MKRQDYDHSKLEGPDASIEISLGDYGMAWIITEETTLFCGRCGGVEIQITDDGFEDGFDFIEINNDIDIKAEYNWVDFDSVNSFIGGGFFEQPLQQQIYDLTNYYGWENIFGDLGGDITLKDILRLQKQHEDSKKFYEYMKEKGLDIDL